jgi:hypothetical protein
MSKSFITLLSTLRVFLIVLITSIVFNSCGFSSANTEKKIKRNCNSISEPISKNLGELKDKKGAAYNVSIKFYLIKTASAYKGSSEVIFTKESTKATFKMSLPSQLPVAINPHKDGLVYCVNNKEKVVPFDSLGKVLCTPDDCFEKE